jgi:hypothetical protein
MEAERRDSGQSIPCHCVRSEAISMIVEIASLRSQ